MGVSIGLLDSGPYNGSFAMLTAIHAVDSVMASTAMSASVSEEADLRIVFMPPGEIYQPPLIGMRVGRLMPRDKKLLIQIGISEADMLRAQPEVFVFDAIRKAIDVAEHRFNRHKLRFTAAEWLRHVDSAEAALTPPRGGKQ